LITTLLIIHALCAVFMLGALTHQALSLWWPPRPGERSFFSSFRAVRAAAYSNTIVVLFVVTATLGAILYPSYRLAVRVVLEDLRLNAANGVFELKEHLVTIGLGLLPAYWYYWRQPLAENRIAIKALTTMLALIVWWGFIVGHVLNNIRGFGA
jgi:hypothetical protein